MKLNIQLSDNPDFVIGDPSNPYMLRWYLIPRNDEFNVYYHRILRDDDDRALHDHPWKSISILIKGQLLEISDNGSKIINPGDLVFREATHSHRLQLPQGVEFAETLFITGPKIRDWGFYCPKGWIPWQQFVSLDNTGIVGRGCDE